MHSFGRDYGADVLKFCLWKLILLIYRKQIIEFDVLFCKSFTHVSIACLVRKFTCQCIWFGRLFYGFEVEEILNRSICQFRFFSQFQVKNYSCDNLLLGKFLFLNFHIRPNTLQGKNIFILSFELLWRRTLYLLKNLPQWSVYFGFHSQSFQRIEKSNRKFRIVNQFW